MARWCYC